MQTHFTRRLSAPLALLCLFVFSASLYTTARAQTAEGVRQAKRALVISLDGFDARYLLRRDEYGLKIPTLRRLLAEGASASGVVSVYPSVTYPAHTTLVTGAAPRRHGIYGNEMLDSVAAPSPRPWYWFARDIRTDTLWNAAARRRLSTGMVSWPVATGAGDFNVPEIWKAGTNPGDDFRVTIGEIGAHARPRGLVEEIARRDAELYRRVTKDEGDDMRTRFAEYIIEEKRPHLMFVHLFDLDHFQHDFGPFTPEAFATLEKSDAYVARLLAAAERAGTLAETAVFIVSDHGFKPTAKRIHPGVLLERAGLVKVRREQDAKGETRTVVGEWRALPYASSGSCAIVLRDPRDREALAIVRNLLKAASVMDGGLFQNIFEAHELRTLGANPRASLMLEAGEGYSFGNNLTGELVTPSKDKGNHGYLPTRADYRASFIASGAGVARRGDLGVVPMTDIAPTIARTLGLRLRTADGRALKL
ncbi:MAG TPA: ectonucleotide pyrophosphatase/phosphodiesterase [Pyrinomonadaceae bacterium]|jgi:predicted AlkP superfamily pyrophosphatase or phosphodiesterase|nr:ectonucleotide pyrophosphatase/phosphodiesterase [Pyrinomonadaceae bacterium]